VNSRSAATPKASRWERGRERAERRQAQRVQVENLVLYLEVPGPLRLSVRREDHDVNRRTLGPGRLEKHGGRWYGIWTDARGKRHRRILSTDREVAERAFRKIVRDRDLEIAGLGNEEGQERPLAEVVALYKSFLATHRRPRYVKAVGYTLDAILAELSDGARIRDVSVPRILLYRTKRLAAGVSNRTCNSDSGILRACLNWARSSGYVATNPIENLRPLPETEDTQVKRRRALSEEEIGVFVEAAVEADRERASRFAAEKTIASGILGRAFAEKRRMVPMPQAPFWKTLVVSGLRYGEAATLRWSDLDEDDGVATVRPEVAKSKRGRLVPIPSYLVEEIRAFRQLQAFVLGRVPKPSDLVFLSPKHRPLSPHGNPARILLKKLLVRAGIAYEDERGRVSVDIHALRRTAGTRLARFSVPLATVSAIMGHSDVRLTQRFYVDLRIADTKRAIEAVPAVRVASASETATTLATAARSR
jgi:integrase